MLINVEHIGIAVKDLELAEKNFEKILGVPSYKREEVESEHVITSFFKINSTKIELLQPTSETGAISKFLEKKGEGIHHLAFETSNLEVELERLKQEGFTVLPGFPKKGADNKRVAFLHPKDTTGVLVEICSEISE